MSTPEDAARKRRERLLAKAEERMKIVSGERSAPTAEEGARTEEVAPSTPAATEDNRPRWERKWEADVSAVDSKREIPLETLKQLEVTEKLAVEAPKLDPNVQIKPVPISKVKTPFFNRLKLDSLLTSLTAAYLGYQSGITDGEFVFQNVWLPFGSLLLFALLTRVIISYSLRKLHLIKPASKTASSGSSWIDTAVKFAAPPLVPLVNTFWTVSGFLKDSYDDMMLFIFAHGIASTMMMMAADSGTAQPSNTDHVVHSGAHKTTVEVTAKLH